MGQSGTATRRPSQARQVRRAWKPLTSTMGAGRGGVSRLEKNASGHIGGRRQGKRSRRELASVRAVGRTPSKLAVRDGLPVEGRVLSRPDALEGHAPRVRARWRDAFCRVRRSAHGSCHSRPRQSVALHGGAWRCIWGCRDALCRVRRSAHGGCQSRPRRSVALHRLAPPSRPPLPLSLPVARARPPLW
jgi:hypothetical protein